MFVIGILAGLAGFFLIPNVSLYLAYSAEVTFPIGEGFSRWILVRRRSNIRCSF
jgi:hypothetical protein